MRHDDSNEPLRVTIDTHQCQISPAEIARMKDDLDALTRMVENFPTPELHVLVGHNARTTDFTVKTSLLLPGQTLVASEHNPAAHAAYEHCLNVLMDTLKDYKARLGNEPERQKLEKGTHKELWPTLDPDQRAVDAAVAAGDYTAFRAATQGYEGPLRDRIGRWLERSPETDGQVGRRFTIADVVEGVFLATFDGYDRRPNGVRFGDWLTGLIDPTVKGLMTNTDDELDNVRMARTLQGVPATREEK
jgi:ribosome-associated translation inhibitor RaiA